MVLAVKNEGSKLNEEISKAIEKSSNNDENGRKFITFTSLYKSFILKYTKEEINQALIDLYKNGNLEFSFSAKDFPETGIIGKLSSRIYLNKSYSVNIVENAQNITKNIVIDKNSANIFDYIIGLSGIIMSMWFTNAYLKDINDNMIRILLSFVISSIGSILLSYIFSNFRDKKFFHGIICVCTYFIILFFNMFCTANFLHKGYEQFRIQAEDPKIAEFNILNTQKKIITQEIEIKIKEKDSQLRASTLTTNEQKASELLWIARHRIEPAIAKLKNDLINIDHKLQALDIKKTEKEKSLYDLIEEITKGRINSGALFLFVSVIVSLICDIICPIILGISISRLRKKN